MLNTRTKIGRIILVAWAGWALVLLLFYIVGSLAMYSNCNSPTPKVHCKPVVDMVFGYVLFSIIIPYGAYISLRFVVRILNSLREWINHGSK